MGVPGLEEAAAGGGGSLFREDRVSVWEDEKVLEVDGGGGSTT